MSCNCKNGAGAMGEMVNDLPNKSSNNVFKYVTKSIVFLISLIFLPIIVVFSVWLLFKTIVLNSSIDMKPMLMSIIKNFNTKIDDEEDEELDDEEFFSLTEDDVILLDAEDITNK